jgi:DnaJ-class molecular chaperone
MGNLVVKVSIEIPTRLSKAQKREIEAMDAEIELKQYEKMKRYSDNVETLYGEKPFTK